MSEVCKHKYVTTKRVDQVIEKYYDGKGYEGVKLDKETVIIFCEKCGDSKEISSPVEETKYD